MFEERRKRYVLADSVFDGVDLEGLAQNVIEEDERPVLKQDALLSSIYSRDPESGLPTGDYTAFLGANTSPEVKAYIQNQLLTSHDLESGLPAESEDELFDYIRQKGESLEDYFARIKAKVDERNELERKQKVIDDANS